VIFIVTSTNSGYSFRHHLGPSDSISASRPWGSDFDGGSTSGVFGYPIGLRRPIPRRCVSLRPVEATEVLWCTKRESPLYGFRTADLRKWLPLPYKSQLGDFPVANLLTKVMVMLDSNQSLQGGCNWGACYLLNGYGKLLLKIVFDGSLPDKIY
jgi:hypothetical protein